MRDIVERLRIGRETCGVDMCRIREAKSGCTCAEAADEIERLREALREISCGEKTCGCVEWGVGISNECVHGLARAALGEEE